MANNPRYNVHWHGPEVSNIIFFQNLKDHLNSRKTFAFDTESTRFNDFNAIGQVLTSCRNNIIISTGRNGRELLDRIIRLNLQESILGVIIFCLDYEKHSQLANEFKMVKGVYKDYEQVKRKIYKIIAESEAESSEDPRRRIFIEN